MAGYKFTQLHGRAGERGNPHLNPLFISPPTPIRSTSPFWPVIRDLSRRKGAGGGGADGRYRKSGLEGWGKGYTFGNLPIFRDLWICKTVFTLFRYNFVGFLLRKGERRDDLWREGHFMRMLKYSSNSE